MSEMKLIMESWRTFRLTEEGPRFKENPQHAAALVDLVAKEKDPQKQKEVLLKIAQDKDVAAVMAALQELISAVGNNEETESDIEEGAIDVAKRAYNALGTTVGWGMTGDLPAQQKADEFLQNDPTGKKLAKFSPVLIALAFLGLMSQGVIDIESLTEPGKRKSLANLAVASAGDSTALATSVAELAGDAITEAISEERKKD